MDIEFLQEVIIAEIIFARKRIFILTVYRSPTQITEQFDGFINNLEITINRIQAEKPHMIILTVDFNCRSSQWRPQEVENPEGNVLDELIEINNLCQLINELINIRYEGMSCIDLIITDQPNLIIESGVHPSLDEHFNIRLYLVR